MGMINGGHLVGKYLKEVEKVDIVFGISGGHLESILDSFTEYKIRTIDVRHEQAAAMMAHAWYVYTGQARRMLPDCRAGVCQRSYGDCERLPR